MAGKTALLAVRTDLVEGRIRGAGGPLFRVEGMGALNS